IAEVMTRSVETVRPTDAIAEAARKMKDLDVGDMVVVDELGNVEGIVTDRDIAIRGVAEGKAPTGNVGEIVSHDLVTISPDDTVDQAIKLMRDRAVRRVPVVSEGKPV